MINVYIVNLEKGISLKDVDILIDDVVSEFPDVIVFTGYQRRLQERVLHPIQKAFKNSHSEASEDILVVYRRDSVGPEDLVFQKFSCRRIS